jgi:hypothetical protein
LTATSTSDSTVDVERGPSTAARILIEEAPGSSTSRSTVVSTSNVAVDVNVRVNAHVIVKVMTDRSAFHLHFLSRPPLLRVLPPGGPPIA